MLLAPRVLKDGGTFFLCNESNGDTAKDDKWVGKIGGMTIYTGAQLHEALAQTGFSHIRIEKTARAGSA